MKIVVLCAALIIAVSSNPTSHPHCRMICPPNVVVFCGSDGASYKTNECVVKETMCIYGDINWQSFHMVHYGKCTGHDVHIPV